MRRAADIKMKNDQENGSNNRPENKKALPALVRSGIALLCVPLDLLSARLARTSLCTADADAQYQHAIPLLPSARESPARIKRV